MSQENTALKEMIIKNLTANGYPMKKVSLPLEKMYEVADSKGANLNTILDELTFIPAISGPSTNVPPICPKKILCLKLRRP